MPEAQPPWLVTVRRVDGNLRYGMQESELVSKRKQLVLVAGGASGVVAMKRSIVCGKGLAKLKAGGGHRARQRAVGGSDGIHDEVDTVLHTLACF